MDQVLKKVKKGTETVMEAPEGESPAAATGLVDGEKVEVSPRSSAIPDLPKAPEDALISVKELTTSKMPS